MHNLKQALFILDLFRDVWHFLEKKNKQYLNILIYNI